VSRFPAQAIAHGKEGPIAQRLRSSIACEYPVIATPLWGAGAIILPVLIATNQSNKIALQLIGNNPAPFKNFHKAHNVQNLHNLRQIFAGALQNNFHRLVRVTGNNDVKFKHVRSSFCVIFSFYFYHNSQIHILAKI
jgi:hypothetical protein